MTNGRLEPEVSAREIEQAIATTVSEGRADWFPDLPGRSVRLEPISVRPRALLYGVHLDDGTVPQVLAKVRRDSDAAAGETGRTSSERPRLRTDVAAAAELTHFEYLGLSSIANLFRPDDPRFDTVRPLAELSEHSTILMDFHHALTLHRVLTGQSRLSRIRHPFRARLAVPDVWSDAGGWLRRFHDGSPSEGLAVRQHTRESVLERFAAYSSYFGVRAMADAQSVAREGEALAAVTIPEELPMAVGHGDYAPRNLFVDRSARVTVIDPMPRWVVPRVEDIGRFLIALRLLGLQLHSHGAAYSQAWLADREHEFVTGYFGETSVPLSLLRTYEVLILLDKWSALSERGDRGRDRFEAAGVRLAAPYITRQARRLLDLAQR